LARADGSLCSLLPRRAKIDVLVIDDGAMAPLDDASDFGLSCKAQNLHQGDLRS